MYVDFLCNTFVLFWGMCWCVLQTNKYFHHSILLNFVLYIYRYFTCMYAYVPLKCLAPIEPREGVLSILELELQMDVKYQMGFGNQTQVLW